MNKLIRGVITGSVVGAAVGVAMLLRKNNRLQMMNYRRNRLFGRKSGNTFRMLRNQAMDWTSSIREGTGALTRSLTRRVH